MVSILNRNDYRMITKAEEHGLQFASKRTAQRMAKSETRFTNRTYQILLATTWRDLEPRICWTIVLKRAWIGGRLVAVD